MLGGSGFGLGGLEFRIRGKPLTKTATLTGDGQLRNLEP